MVVSLQFLLEAVRLTPHAIESPGITCELSLRRQIVCEKWAIQIYCKKIVQARFVTQHHEILDFPLSVFKP